MHKMLIEDDEGKTVAVPLMREEITIGRLEGNTIRLTEQNVSRRHARLTLRSGVLRIEDLGSYNGTSLNGSALAGVATLKGGDVILIGDYRLGIEEDRQGQVPAGPESSPANAAAPPPIADEMEAQPTMPLGTVGAPTAFSEPPARLVITGRFDSGAEFILDRPSQVVGRTPENDIVLNHKSISRHHAKILRDGNRYTMLDLESANGVRIRGTQHDRVELKSGDVIELGEVRLRFLAGDADLYDQRSAWYRDKRKLALAGGLGALVLALVILLASGSSPAKRQLAAADRALPAPKAPAPALPTPASLPAPPPSPASAAAAVPVAAEPSVPLSDLLAQARASAQQEKWSEALALADKATVLAPGSAEAAEMRKDIVAEQTNQGKLAALEAALARKDFDRVVQGAAEISEGSMYRPRAVELANAARPQALAVHLENAKASYAANQCEAAKSEAQAVLALDPDHKRAAAIVRHCDAVANPPAAATVAPKPEPKPVVRRPAPAVALAHPNPAAPRSSDPTARSEAPAPAVDADKLIKDAQQSWFRGQYVAAIDSARRALRAKPNLSQAYQIIAVCSCALHDAESAARAIDKLDERNRQFVKTACQKSGISF